MQSSESNGGGHGPHSLRQRPHRAHDRQDERRTTGRGSLGHVAQSAGNDDRARLRIADRNAISCA